MKIDKYAKLEFGLRIPSNRQNGRWGLAQSQLRDSQEKVEWAKTEAHPVAPKFWAIPREIEPGGFVSIGDAEAVGYFDNGNGFPMVKVVCDLRAGYYAVPAQFAKGLFEFDRVQPRRQSGEYVYSLPLHGVHAVSTSRFFFVILVEGQFTRAAVKVVRIRVTRIAERQFRVAANLYWIQRDAPLDIAPDYRAVEDLPMKQAFENYQRLYQGESLLPRAVAKA